MRSASGSGPCCATRLAGTAFRKLVARQYGVHPPDLARPVEPRLPVVAQEGKLATVLVNRAEYELRCSACWARTA